MLAAGAAAPSGQKGKSIPMSPNQDQAGQAPAVMPTPLGSISCSYLFPNLINIYFIKNEVMAILPGRNPAVIKSCNYCFCSTNVYLIKNII